MRKILLILLFLPAFYSNAQVTGCQVEYGYYDRPYVTFQDNINVRANPSLKAQVIGKLPHNSNLKPYQGAKWKYDSIGNHKGYWRPITHHNGLGYIWEEALCQTLLTSELDTAHHYLIQFSNHQLQIKHFKNGKYEKEQSFSFPTKQGIRAAVPLGKLDHKKGKEIVAIVFDQSTYQLFSITNGSLSLYYEKLKDDSYLTGNYKKFNHCITTSHFTNMRSDTNLTSSIITKLPKNSQIKLIKKGKNQKLNNEWGNWVKVQWKEKTGYIWSNLLAIPKYYVESNLGNESFLLTTKGLFVFKNQKIISHMQDIYHSDLFYVKENTNLEGNAPLLIAYTMGESCGAYNGTHIYTWNGEKIIFIGADGGIGDGGYSESNSTSFITNKKGVKNKVAKTYEIGESFPFPKFKTSDSEDGRYVSFYEEEKIYKLTRDSLVEIASKNKSLKTCVKEKFGKNYHVYKYRFADINNDNIEDAVCVISNSSHVRDYAPPGNIKIVVALGKNNGNYTVLQHNSSLLNENYSAIEIELTKAQLSIYALYNVGYEKEENAKGEVTKFTFLFDQSEKRFYWKTKTEAIQREENWDSKWDIKEFSFHKNKIDFEKAWAN